ncbi:MAG: c-type cytochrome domain-containing protein, partial [Isosphaeraceae bacterium]
MTEPLHRHARHLVIAIGVVALSTASGERAQAGGPGEPDAGRLFRERIQPLLKAQCHTCHSATSKKLGGGLRLDSRQAMLDGGDSGPAVVPGKPDESLILQAIRHQDGLAMPPKKPRLAESTIAEFVRWIQAGAPFEGTGAPTTTALSPLQKAREHWAFRPVVKPAGPDVADRSWTRNPIDAFVLAKLESKGWRPAPPASRAEWLRRVTF